jgi:predicted permease
MASTLLSFFLVVYGFLLFGYGMKKLFPSTAGFSRPLSIYIMTYLTPVIILNAFWSLDFSTVRIVQLPLINLITIVLSVLPALIVGRLFRLHPEERGSLTSCTMFSNNGITLGGFLCYLLYGDEGLYLANLYTAFFIPTYYLIGFPLVRTVSGKKSSRFLNPLHELLANPVSIVPVSFMALGLLLNLAGIRRPDFLNTLSTRYLMYLSAAFNSLSIGLGLRFMKSLRYAPHGLSVSAIKFLFNPAIGFGSILLFGFLGLENTLPAKVIFIQSFMPAAIMSVIMVKIFELNEDLANSAWIISNFSAIPMIPVMIALSRLL